MIGLVARLASLTGESERESDDVDDDHGLFWVSRNECRTCGEGIAEPEGKPTAPDTSDPIANATASGREPQSTFCSEECRDEFLEVFSGD
jgi:hypothetical protein